MSVKHIDFYGVDRATKLPLINVEVPTRLFFLAALGLMTDSDDTKGSAQAYYGDITLWPHLE